MPENSAARKFPLEKSGKFRHNNIQKGLRLSFLISKKEGELTWAVIW